MVITSQNAAVADSPASTAVTRRPLKQSSSSRSRRRGLSAFYSSKSQSFNCMRDLQSNPFCQSTCLLGKSPPTDFSSIQEELCCDLIEQQQGDSPSTHPNGSMSEPGSPQPHHGLLARHSWPSSGSSELEAGAPFAPPMPSSWHECAMASEAQGAALQQLQLGVLGPQDGSGGDSRCNSPWLGPTLSSSSDGSMGSMEACDASFEGTGHAFCCLQQHQQPPTDSLCEALKAASLAAPRAAHHAAAMLPLAASYGFLG